MKKNNVKKEREILKTNIAKNIKLININKFYHIYHMILFR